MESEDNFFRMVIGTKGNTLMGSRKEKEHIIGTTEQYIKVSLKMVFGRDMVSGNSEINHTKVHIWTIKGGEREYIIGTKLLFIKDHLLMI
jgi:hypothetical protein